MTSLPLLLLASGAFLCGSVFTTGLDTRSWTLVVLAAFTWMVLVMIAVAA